MHFGVRVFGYLEIVVADCWLCYFGPRPAVGLPQGFLVASEALLGLLYLFGSVGRLLGRL